MSSQYIFLFDIFLSSYAAVPKIQNEIRKTNYKSGQFYYVLEINLGNVARLHDFQETLVAT